MKKKKVHNRYFPDEIVPSHRPGGVRAIVICVLAFLIFGNVASAFYLDVVRDSQKVLTTTSTVPKKWELLQTENHVTTLILGDSAGAVGADPSVFEDVFGGPSINACTIGNFLVLDDAWMLEQFFAEDRTADRIVLVHVYDVLTRSNVPDAILPLVPGDVLARHSAELSRKSAGMTSLKAAIKKSTPLFFQNRTIVSSFTSIFKNTDRPLFSLVDTGNDDGFSPLDGEGTDENMTPDIEWHKKHCRLLNLKNDGVSETNKNALIKIVKMAEEHQTPVYFVLAPTVEGLWGDSGFQSCYARLSQQIDEIAGSSQFFHHVELSPENKVFSFKMMQNADHVLVTAARAYSRGIAMVIESLER